jgi:membrane protein DedA with SNARE-associated domain
VEGVFGDLYDLLASPPQAYLIIYAIAALDAVFPVVPSESAAIVSGVLAAIGELSFGLALIAAALGAYTGDNSSYLLGRHVGHPIRMRFFSGEKAERMFNWARQQLKERGGYIILVARFIPGGRTAVTLTSGIVHFPWPRFAAFAAIAAVLWATYSVSLGYIGGTVFEEHPFLALGVALGVAFLITLAVEGYRHLRKRPSAET